MISCDLSNGVTIISAEGRFTRSPAEILAYLATQPAGVESIRQAAAIADLCADVAAFAGDGLAVSGTVDWSTGVVTALKFDR